MSSTKNLPHPLCQRVPQLRGIGKGRIEGIVSLNVFILMISFVIAAAPASAIA